VSTTGRGSVQPRNALRTAALLVGAVFLLVGLLGFVPGITTDYGDLGAAGWSAPRFPDIELLIFRLRCGC
jgi:hypothetical protein